MPPQKSASRKSVKMPTTMSTPPPAPPQRSKAHLGYLTVSVVAFVIAITVVAVAGQLVTSDLTQLADQTPAQVQHVAVAVSPLSGRVAGVAVEKARVTVDRADGNTLTIEFEVAPGMTALQALEQAASVYGLTLQTKQFDFGTLVEGIGGIVSGQEGKYWTLYVNGQMAPTGADATAVAPGDRIEFKFEQSPF
ncbi:MAG: DUF4430 domain-containing protein [Patescibacteria group bacterium]